MFSLRDLRFALCSLELDVVRAQRIMGFILPINLKGRNIRSHGANWVQNSEAVCVLSILLCPSLLKASVADFI